MKQNLYFLFIILFSILGSKSGLFSQCLDNDLAFQAGEKITYEVAYNLGNIYINAGEVYFKADITNLNNQTYFFFESFGQSYRQYDWIYKVRDKFQSVVEPDSFLPYWFTRDTYEGGYEVNNRYDYDFEHKRVIASTSNSDKPLTIETLPIDPCTFDVLTAIYYARSLDFDQYEPGEKIPIKFIIDGEFYELYIRLAGNETIKNRDGKTYKTIKFSAQLVEGTIFKGGEDLYVWITDDKNKIPVLIEAKIIVGSIKAYMTGYDGLKYELESLIEED